MEKHSKNQKTKLLIFNYPPKTSSFHSTDSDLLELILPAVDISYGGTEEPDNSPKMSCTNIYKVKNKKKSKNKNEGEILHVEELYKEKDVKTKKETLKVLKILMGIGFMGSKTGRKSGNQSKSVGESSQIAPILELLPRREINIWVRRNMASPPTRQV